MIHYPHTLSVPKLSFKHGILVGVVLVSAFVLMCQFVMWYVAAALLFAWTPFCIQYTLSLVKRDARLAIYFVFLVLQSVHMCEHIAQMVQIHILGRVFSASHGIFGAYFDVEWFHFFFDSIWIPFCMIWLLMLYNGRDKWLLILFPLAVWHAAEHVVIMDYYIKTGIVGSPGILASGGLIGSPLSRPDLHFIYNLFETVIMIQGFRRQLERKAQPKSRLRTQSNAQVLAEAYIRSGSGALYRHYSIPAIQDILRGKIGSQGCIAFLDDSEVVNIVQRIRNEYGMAPIADYNMPGYIDPDEFIDLSGI